MNESVESSFVDKGIHYQIKLCIQQSDVFSILLIDEDQPDRWEGLFNGQIINKLTTSAGNTKKIQIFFKMLQNAILGNSNEVSFTILSQRDINEMRYVSQSQTNDTGSSINQLDQNESRYFILEQHTEFDRVKYPLRLINKPYSTEELKTIIRSLRSENKRLSGFEKSNSQREKVRNLEQQIYDLNGSIRQLTEEKDQTIENLRKKITDLEEKAKARNSANNYNNMSSSKTIRYSNNNSHSISKNSTATRKKQMVPTIGRKVNTKFQLTNSRYSSASSSAASSRRSSAANSRKSSANGSRKSSAASSRNNSARSSASNSRPSSRNSNGSFKRFDPTEWCLNHQRKKSRNNSRNNSRNQSPSGQNNSNNSNYSKVISQNDAHIKRLKALVQKKYL